MNVKEKAQLEARTVCRASSTPEPSAAAAQARGPVRRFGPVEPSLAELFRGAVEEREAA